MLKFQSNNLEMQNEIYSLNELRDSLRRSCNTAEGRDEINCEFFKWLPDPSLHYLLEMLIWVNGKVPELWRLVTVAPIPKPGIDSPDSSNYRNRFDQLLM